MQYRKKPVVVDVFRLQLYDAMPEWFADKVASNDIIIHPDGTCDIYTLEGVMHGDYGDYIIKGVNGEVYPCKPDIFAKTYEPVD